MVKFTKYLVTMRKRTYEYCSILYLFKVDIVDSLVGSEKTDVNLCDNSGATPLFIAAQRGHAMLVDRLLRERRVDVNMDDGSGNTPLIAACGHGMYPEIVRNLVMHDDIEVDARNKSGATALIEAARLGHVEIVDILVSLS